MNYSQANEIRQIIDGILFDRIDGFIDAVNSLFVSAGTTARWKFAILCVLE